MDESRTRFWTTDWSRRRRVGAFALGLLMLYLHSLYILAFYVPEEEYWFPFWTGMTVVDRLLSLVLAFIANFGLLAAPFLRTPGRRVRTLLAASLCCGITISTVWLARRLVVMGFYPLWPSGPLRSGLIVLLFFQVIAYMIYAIAIYLYFRLLMSLKESR
jgi:hypothetical protein